jgi:hypothetical protein
MPNKVDNKPQAQSNFDVTSFRRTQISQIFVVGTDGISLWGCRISSWGQIDISSGHMCTQRSLLQVGKKSACDQSYHRGATSRLKINLTNDFDSSTQAGP